MKKILAYAGVLGFLSLSLVLLQTFDTNAETTGMTLQELQKKKDETKNLLKLSDEDNKEFKKGKQFFGKKEWMNYGEAANNLAEVIDVNILDVKVKDKEKDKELIPISFDVEITNKDDSDKYFYDFYDLNINGIPVWDKKTYNVKLEANKSETISVKGWIPGKNMDKNISVRDILNENEFELKMVMSEQEIDINRFFKQIKKTPDIEGLDQDLSGLYLVEKSSETEIKKDN